MQPTTRRQTDHVPPGRRYLTEGHVVPGFTGKYSLTIYLPPGYDESREAYPVAYMFDGQNLFGDQGSYAGGWHVHEVLDRRAARGKIVPVVVAIHHGGPTRIEELSPWGLQGHPGRGDAFLDWVIGPLAAKMATELRILDGPENTMIGGSSLGGLMAFYAFFRTPGVFGKVLSMSPSVWVNPPAIEALITADGLPWRRKLYIDAGGGEERTMRVAEVVVEQLAHNGFVAGTDLLWRSDPRGGHNERTWHRRLPTALRFLYG